MSAEQAVPATPAAWLAAAAHVLAEFVRALAPWGVGPDPRLRLVRGELMAPYYERATMTIGISMPDPATAGGRLFWLLAARKLDFEAPEQAVEAAGRTLPFMVAHELGHHLRHRYCTSSESDFVEEQAASILALAFLGEHPDLRRTIPALRELAHRASGGLEPASAAAHAHLPGFRSDLGEVLVAKGWLERTQLERLRREARTAGVGLETALARSDACGLLAAAARAKAESEAYFNARYSADLAEYWRFGAEWLLAYLARDERPSLREAVRTLLPGPGLDARRHGGPRSPTAEVTRRGDLASGGRIRRPPGMPRCSSSARAGAEASRGCCSGR